MSVSTPELVEQLHKLAAQLSDLMSTISVEQDKSSQPDQEEQASPSAFRFSGKPDSSIDRLIRSTRPSLPDPRLVRRIIRQRQLRARFFDGELFADPAWDMLLDLTAARAEHTRVSVTSLCIASQVPPTTALRWIGQMTEAGMLERVEDDLDRRRAFVALTDSAADALARFFQEIGKDAFGLI